MKTGIIIIVALLSGCAQLTTEDRLAGERCEGDACDAGVEPDVAVEDEPDEPQETCKVRYFPDSDQDGYGDANAAPLLSCRQPNGYTLGSLDCDDTDPSIHPDAEELPGDGIDQDCDRMELCLADDDGDGHATPGSTVLTEDVECAGETLLRADAPVDDCDDQNPVIWGGAPELCDGIDNDCDGTIDSGGECPCEYLGDETAAYLFCDERVTWSEAALRCDGYGYMLVTIDDQTEDVWLGAQLADRDVNAAWIGASDLEQEGSFVWRDGNPVSYNWWRDGEPNDTSAGGNSSGADCVARIVDGEPGWADRLCGDRYAYVCQAR